MKSKHSKFAGKPPNIALEFGKKWSGKPGKVREFHCCDKLRTLLWYLSEVLVGLAFFDSEISFTEKAEMVAALSKTGNDNPAPRVESLDTELHPQDLITQKRSIYGDVTAVKQRKS